MSDPTLGNLIYRIDRLEENQEEVGSLKKGLVYSQNQVKDLTREVDDLRRMAREARDKAVKVAKALELKEQQAEADARSMSRIATVAKIALSVLLMVIMLWSGKLVSGIEQLRALLGGGK